MATRTTEHIDTMKIKFIWKSVVRMDFTFAALTNDGSQIILTTNVKFQYHVHTLMIVVDRLSITDECLPTRIIGDIVQHKPFQQKMSDKLSNVRSPQNYVHIRDFHCTDTKANFPKSQTMKFNKWLDGGWTGINVNWKLPTTTGTTTIHIYSSLQYF